MNESGHREPAPKRTERGNDAESDHLHQPSTSAPLMVGENGTGYFRCGVGRCTAVGHKEKDSISIVWTS